MCISGTQPSEVTFLAFDTGSHRLLTDYAPAVEVGTVHFRLDGRELITFQMLIDPGAPHPKDGQQVHSITPSEEFPQ
jgi:hypothetical protein